MLLLDEDIWDGALTRDLLEGVLQGTAVGCVESLVSNPEAMRELGRDLHSLSSSSAVYSAPRLLSVCLVALQYGQYDLEKTT